MDDEPTWGKSDAPLVFDHLGRDLGDWDDLPEQERASWWTVQRQITDLRAEMKRR
jgi:hypothetical protein